MNREKLREQMLVTKKWTYFDHAAVAPLPRSTADAMRQVIEQQMLDGDVHWPGWRKQVEEARQLGAKLIGAENEEIALVRNTTEGIGLVADGYPWQPGDNVVVPRSEFPSNLYPWRNLERRGVEVRLLDCPDERLDPNALDALCDERTRIVSASWVGYATGWRNDPAELAEIAHRHGALFFLDAIQGLGVFPINVKTSGIDFLAADGHKWLLGPEGAGLFFIRREHLDRLNPLLVGWNSVATAGDYTNTELRLKETAGRYEGGSYNMVGIVGLRNSLQLLVDYGSENVARDVLAVTDQLTVQLQSLGADIASDRSDDHSSGIVSFTMPGKDTTALLKRLQGAGVVVRERAGRLRASPHAYHTVGEIGHLLDALQGHL